MKSKPPVVLVAAAVLALATAGAFAHGGATGIVKERMDLMESVGQAMKSLTAMMRGKESYDVERVRDLARTIGGHGGEAMTSLFPEGSIEEPSDALPTIWTNWDRFTALAEQHSIYSAALDSAADNDRTVAVGMGMGMGMGVGQGQGQDLGAGMGQGMMTSDSLSGPSAEDLATMPPDAVFLGLAQTCSSCHQDFRKEQ